MTNDIPENFIAGKILPGSLRIRFNIFKQCRNDSQNTGGSGQPGGGNPMNQGNQMNPNSQLTQVNFRKIFFFLKK